jgi:tetratricopeptide (TPR) repeat protein
VSTDAAFVCADAAVDVSIAKAEFDRAAVVLQSFIGRVPGHIPSLLKLVEVCVDGGLEETMYETQAQLADAYLSTSQAAEARVIAEDLVAREPWESAHIERFRRALVMLRVSEPDSVIAERLSGQSPFMATDHYSDPIPEPVVAPAAEEPAPAAAPAASVVSAPAVPVVALAPAPIPPPSAAMNRAPEPWTGASTATAPGAGKLEDTGEIDLTGFLGAMEASEPAAAPPPAAPPESLDEVFKDCRSDAGRKVAADQSAQHMKLGRTYLEMGMLEEAARALTTAARSPMQRFEAGSLLGRLYREQGDLPHAIEWFERAAEVPAPAVDDGRALLYDLALALEEAGEISRALGVLLELQAEAGEYRDAAERTSRLTRAQAGG